MELFIFGLSPIINALWDAKFGETHHLRSLFIRGASIIVIAIAMSYIFPNKWEGVTDSMWWLYMVMGFIIEFTFFDYLYNLFTGNKWYYIGDPKYHMDDITYKIYAKLKGLPMLSLKFILFMTGIAIYTQLDLF